MGKKNWFRIFNGYTLESKTKLKVTVCSSVQNTFTDSINFVCEIILTISQDLFYETNTILRFSEKLKIKINHCPFKSM